MWKEKSELFYWLLLPYANWLGISHHIHMLKHATDKISVQASLSPNKLISFIQNVAKRLHKMGQTMLEMNGHECW